jgi:Domain of unknown function (DUF4062)
LNQLATELNRYLKNCIEPRQRYPIYVPLDDLADDLSKATGRGHEEVRSYLACFFDLCRVIGCVEYDKPDTLVLGKDVQAAATRALCLAMCEGISGVFNFYESGYLKNPTFGSWFLHRLEEFRQIQNPDREPSRSQDYIVVLVKAEMEGKPVILFQYDNQREQGHYKLIGGMLSGSDRGVLSHAARREIEEELRTFEGHASNIQPRQLSSSPFEYGRVSERVGAYTRYRVSVFDCTLRLPADCLKESFQGEKRRLTRWIPVEQIKTGNDEFSQSDVLGWIVENGWIAAAQTSTKQTVVPDQVAANQGGVMQALNPPTVFVSSTFRDLKPYRDATKEQIARRDFLFRGMEHFGADPAGNTPAKKIIDAVQQADVYVGVFGVRYGYVASDSGGLSMTELEFRAAENAKKQMLLYVMHDNASVKACDLETDAESVEKLAQLKRYILSKYVVYLFSSVDELARQVYEDLGKLERRVGNPP